MQETLSQRHFTNRRTFRLDDEGVQVENRSFFGSQSYRLPYESISSDRFRVTESNSWWLVGSLVFLMFAIGIALRQSGQLWIPNAFGWLFASACFGARFWASRIAQVGFRGTSAPLVFLAGRPSELELNRFIAKFQSRRLQRFYELIEEAPQPQVALANLDNLRQSGFLTKEEVEILRRRSSRQLEQPQPRRRRDPSGGQYL